MTVTSKPSWAAVAGMARSVTAAWYSGQPRCLVTISAPLRHAEARLTMVHLFISNELADAPTIHKPFDILTSDIVATEVAST
ncbi:hypothetical protein ABIE78_001600 [Sinorhizobium fredii]